MSRPLVSVVVPVHNGQCYLAAAIESALRQCPPPLELTVVDDGSSDSSLAIAQRFGPPVRCVSHERRGIGAARNSGVAKSTGEYVAFLDADDLWTSGASACRLEAFAADPHLDLVFGHVRQFTSPDATGHLLRGEQPEPGYLPGGALIRRTVFQRVGLFREDLVTGEFIDWMARARELGVRETLLLDHVLWRRIHTSNHGIVRADARKDYARVIKWALDRRRAAAAVRNDPPPTGTPDNVSEQGSQ